MVQKQDFFLLLLHIAYVGRGGGGVKNPATLIQFVTVLFPIISELIKLVILTLVGQQVLKSKF